MTQWEYSICSYSRNNKLQSMVPVVQPGFEMTGIAKSDCLHLSTFLKKAGDNGWELASYLLPFPAGMQLTEEVEGKPDRDYTIQEPADIQWMIFKRPR